MRLSLRRLCITATSILIAATGCSGEGSLKQGGSLQVTSVAFEPDGAIPARFACTGENLSPTLSWSPGPDSTKAYAVTCIDPDAPRGAFTHWVIYDLPVGLTGLPEGVPDSPELENGARQGLNDFGRIGYGGPCPPSGKPHHYIFKVYALDAPTGLEAGEQIGPVTAAMKSHILATGTITGLFSR
jgi:Raf kinase inhibitor-like YbhB/YbcL family protein